MDNVHYTYICIRYESLFCMCVCACVSVACVCVCVCMFDLNVWMWPAAECGVECLFTWWVAFPLGRARGSNRSCRWRNCFVICSSVGSRSSSSRTYGWMLVFGSNVFWARGVRRFSWATVVQLSSKHEVFSYYIEYYQIELFSFFP